MSQTLLAIAATKESGPVKAIVKPISVKAGTTPTPPAEAPPVSPAANDSHNAALVSSPETNLTSLAALKQTAPNPQAAVPNVKILTAVKAEKTDAKTAKQSEIEASKLAAAATHSPITESSCVPPSTVAAKVVLADTVQSTGRQTELSQEDSSANAVEPNDNIKATQATKSLQAEIKLTLQDPHPEAKAEITAAGPDRNSKKTKDVDIMSSEETKKSTAIKVRLCSVILFLIS